VRASDVGVFRVIGEAETPLVHVEVKPVSHYPLTLNTAMSRQPGPERGTLTKKRTAQGEQTNPRKKTGRSPNAIWNVEENRRSRLFYAIGRAVEKSGMKYVSADLRDGHHIKINGRTVSIPKSTEVAMDDKKGYLVKQLRYHPALIDIRALNTKKGVVKSCESRNERPCLVGVTKHGRKVFNKVFREDDKVAASCLVIMSRERAMAEAQVETNTTREMDVDDFEAPEVSMAMIEQANAEASNDPDERVMRDVEVKLMEKQLRDWSAGMLRRRYPGPVFRVQTELRIDPVHDRAAEHRDTDVAVIHRLSRTVRLHLEVKRAKDFQQAIGQARGNGRKMNEKQAPAKTKDMCLLFIIDEDDVRAVPEARVALSADNILLYGVYDGRDDTWTK